MSSESKGGKTQADKGMLMKVAGMIGPHLEKAGPYVAKAGELLEKAEPYVLAFFAYCQHIWSKLEPYHPMEFLPAIVGATYSALSRGCPNGDTHQTSKTTDKDTPL